MKKIIIPIVILFSIANNVAQADTSTDKIATIPAPTFKPNPVTVPAQQNPSLTPQSTLELTTKSGSAVSPEIIKPPAFSQEGTDINSTSILTNEPTVVKSVAVKPVTISPQSVEERLPSAKQSEAPVPTPVTTIAPAPIQPYLLDSSGPGLIWKFIFIFLVLAFIVIAENRIRLKKKLKK